jgi:sugar-phosphatase
MDFLCQAIIFDLDGVLIDSNPISERHWQAWAERHGLPYDEIAQIHHGRPTVETMRRVAPHLDVAEEARLKETAEAKDTDGLTVYPGVETLLSQLPQGRWAIATSGTRQTATFRLRHVGLPQPTVLVTADDVKRGKPAPDPYLLAAERLGVAPCDCLIIEDAPAGVEAAKAAGTKVVAVTTTNQASALSQADAIALSISAVQVDLGLGERLDQEIYTSFIKVTCN